MKRYEQKLLSEIPEGGAFVFTDWFYTRLMFEVEKHYNGFNWTYDDEGKRRKGNEVIPRTKVTVIDGEHRWQRVFDNADMYVLQITGSGAENTNQSQGELFKTISYD